MTADRAGYIAGLRVLADLLERHADLPMPTQGHDCLPMSIYFWGDGARDGLARFARIFPGALRKDVRDYTDEPGGAAYFDLHGTLAGLSVKATAMRDKVCTRRVIGTREVVTEVPDPAALAAVQMVPVTVVEDVVEWDCGPILAPRTREQEMADAASDGFLDNAEPDVPGADDYLTDVSS